jgi:tetratricopeptide (TPR) repeat protein
LYKSAQDRFNHYLASLRAAGNSHEAADLQARVNSTRKSPSVSESLDAAMEKALNDMTGGRPDKAEMDFKDAVGLAEKLQPTDDRLEFALLQLGGLYAQKHEVDKAKAMLERALKVTEEAHGAQSPQLADPLQGLGRLAMVQGDYKTAVDYFTQAVKVNEKNYGDVNDKVADSLTMLTSVYGLEGAYDQAEPVVLRALQIEETLHGKEDPIITVPLSFLCTVYMKSNKPENAEPCEEQLIPLMEKKFGKDSAFLGSPLKMQAAALRQLGRADEAEKIEQRIQALQTGAGRFAGAPSAQVPAN